MAVTTTATLTSAMQTFYDNRFLAYFKETIVVQKMGQQRPIPMNSGKVIDFFRYHPYSLVTSSGTEGTVGTEVATLAMSFTATIAVWKNHTRISEFLQLTSRDRNLENIVDLMAQNAAESLEFQTQREIALYGATYVRGDVNSTYQFEFTAGGDVSNSTTTTISSGVFDAYSATNDVLIGSVIVFTRGFNYGQARVISDYVATNGVITWETAVPETPRQAGMDTGTKEIKGWFCEFRDSSATSTAPKSLVQGFQYRAITKAVEMLEKANAPKFPDGFYHGAIDPIAKRQLLQDSDILNLMTRSRPRKMEKNFIGEVGGVNWFLNTMVMRLEDERGTSIALANATFINRTAGKYYVTWVFGQNAFGTIELSGKRQKIIVKTPGPHTVSTPGDEYSTVGWKAYYIAKALNASYAVAILSYQA